MGEGEYKVIVDGELVEYRHWDDIPEKIDEIIKFLPVIPPGPHTQKQHDDIDRLPEIFKNFMERTRCLR